MRLRLEGNWRRRVWFPPFFLVSFSGFAVFSAFWGRRLFSGGFLAELPQSGVMFSHVLARLTCYGEGLELRQ